MSEDQLFQTLANRNREIYAYLFGYPNECQYCHKHIIPEFISEYISKSNNFTYATLLCPNKDCDKTFIAEYEIFNNIRFYYTKIVKYNVISKKFSDEILEVSLKFTEIYNESFFAEQNGLHEICGVGYRKSLEFLIKDFLILNNPEKEEVIKKNTISNCINSFVEDIRLKTTANRAIWLGNDHTHYEKRWEDKDLDDLKTLIQLTINWIESEILTIKFNKSMR